MACCHCIVSLIVLVGNSVSIQYKTSEMACCHCIVSLIVLVDNSVSIQYKTGVKWHVAITS